MCNGHSAGHVRQETWDRRCETGDMRHKTGDVRQETLNRRQETRDRDMIQETGDKIQETCHVRQEAGTFSKQVLGKNLLKIRLSGKKIVLRKFFP